LTPAILRDKAEVLRSAGLVLAQLEIPLETVLCLAEMCQAMRVPLILDPAPAVKLPPEILQGTTWFTPNETEAEYYAGQTVSEVSTLEKLKSLGVRGLILKRGAEGCLLVEENGSTHRIAAPKVHAVDTTAAGDAFNAAFAVALMKKNSPAQSVEFATIAAAISVTRAGAQPSLATAEEVSAALGASNTAP
jgi:ribokinase